LGVPTLIITVSRFNIQLLKTQIMKTQETSTPQMDEIVFEKRNKIYGAYILRKMYNKQVNKALLFSVGILIAGLAYPLASSYKALEHSFRLYLLLKNLWLDQDLLFLR